MKFKDPKYNDLILKQYETTKEVTVIVTPYCEGGCKHCLYNRDQIGDREFGGLMETLTDYLSTCDMDTDKVILAIEGGEVFSEKLLTDEYVANVKKLAHFLYGLVDKSKDWYLACSISPENIRQNGIDIIKELQEEYPCLRLNIAFSKARFQTAEKEERFFNNLEQLFEVEQRLGRKQIGMGVLMTEDFPEREYLKTFAKYAGNKVIDFAEPHMFEGNYFCFNGINATKIYEEELAGTDIELDPCKRLEQPSLHHLDIYVTSRGMRNPFHLLKRPEWIPGYEWDRIRDDEEYRIFGYQQVLDWYGCNDCENLYQCQGMLWTTYYAQKNLYEYNKCLYK